MAVEIKRKAIALTMTDTERERLLAPTTGNGVNIAGADTASHDLDVDIYVTR